MVMVMKTSLVCLLLVAYMGLFYFYNKHIPLKSTKIFSYYYASAVILTVFDLATVFTVNNLELVPDMVNLITHVIYLLSINTTLYLYFLYLRSLLENKIRISGKLRIIQAVPFMVTSVLIAVLPLEYVEGTYNNYSFGPKVYSLHASVILYNLFIVYYFTRYWKLLNREKRVAIFASVPLFVVVSVINIAMPEALFTIAYVILNTVGLMMSNENSEKYLDKQTGMFNQYALGVVLGEYIALNRNVFLVVMTMSETENVRDGIDWKGYVTAMEHMQHFCKKELKHQMYRVSDNGFVTMAGSHQAVVQTATSLINYATEHCGSDISTEYKVFELRKYNSSEKLMSEIVEECTNAINKMAVFDFLTGARNRNSFEKEVQQLRAEGVDAYYFLADLNNLKTTNDAMGHSAGDELLQAMTKLLKETAGKDGMVFRFGGDEFAVLWCGTDAEIYLNALENNCKSLNETRIIPISFAIGYGKILEEGGMQEADRMMYENKARMKGV